MIIIDSNVLVSYNIVDDLNHGKAEKMIGLIANGEYGKAAITDYIFGETLTVIYLRSKSLAKAIESENYMKSSLEMLMVDELAFEGATHIFNSQKNTKLSFTDCTIISMANIYNADYIATFDKDFKKIDGVRLIDS